MKKATQLKKLKAQRAKIDEQEAELKEKLKTKRKRIKARIQQIEAIEKRAERKKDTRRKILIGSMVLSRIDQERGFEVDDMDQLKRELNTFLTKDYDRELFDLGPCVPKKSNQPEEN